MIKEEMRLDNLGRPRLETIVCCDSCGNEINVTPNHKPKFCDMCGAAITDADKRNISEPLMWIEYIEYILENHPDWLIMKLKNIRVSGIDYCNANYTQMPVIIGENMDAIIKFVSAANDDNYTAKDFEPATKAELLEYSRICGNHWRGW